MSRPQDGVIGGELLVAERGFPLDDKLDSDDDDDESAVNTACPCRRVTPRHRKWDSEVRSLFFRVIWQHKRAWMHENGITHTRSCANFMVFCGACQVLGGSFTDNW